MMIKSRHVQTVLLIALFFAFSTDLYLSVSDPRGHFLRNTAAQWIKFAEPVYLDVKPRSEKTVFFRKRVTVPAESSPLTLHMRAFRSASVWMDGQLVHAGGDSSGEWNKDRTIPLPRLSPGEHTITVSVKNQGGPPALLISSDLKPFETDGQWEASADNHTWSKVAFAEKIEPPPLSRDFPDVITAFQAKIFIYLPFFLLVLLFCLFIHSERSAPYVHRRPITAGAFRIVILVAYAALAVNNFIKLPVSMGMDVMGHIDYVLYIAQHRRLPLPTEGGSMFEPPLFYLFSAFIYHTVDQLCSAEAALRALRIIPLLCGLLQIEMAYRALRIVYPNRQDLQAIGTVIGAFLPASIHLSQFVSTEPLAACAASAFILLVLKALQADPPAHKDSDYVWMGLFVGLSLLAKMSILVILPVAVFFLTIKPFLERKADPPALRALSKRMATAAGLALLVAGWYYVRNYLHLGQFIALNSGDGNIVGVNSWWQDPGYRTFSQLSFSFEAFYHPIYSGVTSLWNALYTTFWADGVLSGHYASVYLPPWNFDFMIGGLLLSFFPSLTLLAGLLAMFRKGASPEKLSLTFASVCVLTFLLAIFHQYLAVPIYSIAKGKYMLGLLLCFSILAAGGYDLITQKAPRILKPLLAGLIMCWALSVYAGFFVVTVPDKTRELDTMNLADYLKDKGYYYDAVKQLVKASQTFHSPDVNPQKLIGMIHGLAMRHARDGEDVEALNYFHLLNQMAPEDATVAYNIACLYSKLNRLPESAKWLKMALEKGYSDRPWILSDPDLENLRKSERFDRIVP